MAKTPEGIVKDEVKKLLQEFGAWYYMPVPGGYGAPTLDFLCAINGKAFAVETKAPGKKPTPRQRLTISDMKRKGVPVFVVDGRASEGYRLLYQFVMSHYLRGPEPSRLPSYLRETR